MICLGGDVGAIVPGDDVGTAGKKRARAREPRAAKPEDGYLLSGEYRDRDHGRGSIICLRLDHGSSQ